MWHFSFMTSICSIREMVQETWALGCSKHHKVNKLFKRSTGKVFNELVKRSTGKVFYDFITKYTGIFVEKM